MVAALSLLTGYFAAAQTPLGLNDAVAYALKHKAEAVKARLDIKNSAYVIEEARANALPQINANGGLTYNAILQQMALNMGGQSMVIKMGLPWQSTATVQLDQQIFNLAVFTGLKAARSTKEFYVINAELTEEQIVEKVAGSYYEVFRTQSKIATINSTISNTERVRDVISSLFDNGLARKIDLDRMNVTLNNLSAGKQQLQNALQLQENSLKYLIGMDISEPVVLPEGTFEIDHSLVLDRSAADIENRTEIRLMEQQGQLLHYNKQAIAAQRYPTLALSANYGYLGLGDKFPYFAGSNSGVNWSDMSAVSLNLRVPIFSGFSTRARIQQAQIEIDKYETDLRDTRLALSLALENAFTQLSNSLMTLNVQKSNVNLAQEVLINIENNYKNGLASLTDLLDAETSYADARNSYTGALLDYKLAEVQLVKARGELKSYYSTSH